MTSKALLTGFLKKGRQILQNVVKIKTQNAKVKAAQVTKQQTSAKCQFPQPTADRLHQLWYKIVPRVYFQSLARRLGREAAWRGGRNVPLLAFMGLVVAQHSNEGDEEITCRLQDFVKNASVVSSCPLLQNYFQSLYLDKFELGRQIGQGCNAAVFEAKIKDETINEQDNAVVPSRYDANDTDDNVPDDISEAGSDITVLTNDSEDASFPSSNFVVLQGNADDDSDITFLNMTDDEIEDNERAPTEFEAFDMFDKKSEAGSDISFLSLSDEEIEENERAPTEFEAFDMFDKISEAGSDISIISMSDDDVDDEGVGDDELVLPLMFNIQEECDDTDKWSVGDQLDEEYESMDSDVSDGSGNGSIPGSGKFDLAVKMMFNYGVESKAEAILREMEKETVPARLDQSHGGMDIAQNGNKVRKKRVPPHPNIVEMWGVFVDPVPRLPECHVNYPAALPVRINPKGAGRNMTLFLVMKRYTTTLSDYLSVVQLSLRERLILLTQLLEGVDHLVRHGVAHRDMKSDNILLDTSTDGPPHLVLSDFGCCLADPNNGLLLPYPTDEIDRGGNTALMAPEIACAQPSPHSVLDYRKADLWGVGALAYEILGADNPFYSHASKEMLDSRTYNELQLPPLPNGTPVVVAELVNSLLRRDPTKRPSSRQAADILHILLWAPSHWLSPGNVVQPSEMIWWLITMTTEILLHTHMAKKKSTKDIMKGIFLENLNMNRVKIAMKFLNINVV